MSTIEGTTKGLGLVGAAMGCLFLALALVAPEAREVEIAQPDPALFGRTELAGVRRPVAEQEAAAGPEGADGSRDDR